MCRQQEQFTKVDGFWCRYYAIKHWIQTLPMRIVFWFKLGIKPKTRKERTLAFLEMRNQHLDNLYLRATPPLFVTDNFYGPSEADYEDIKIRAKNRILNKVLDHKVEVMTKAGDIKESIDSRNE